MNGQGMLLPLLAFLAGAGVEPMVSSIKKLQGSAGGTAKGAQASPQQAAQVDPRQAMLLRQAMLAGRPGPPSIGAPPGAAGPPGLPSQAPAGAGPGALDPLTLLALLQRARAGGGGGA